MSSRSYGDDPRLTSAIMIQSVEYVYCLPYKNTKPTKFLWYTGYCYDLWNVEKILGMIDISAYDQSHEFVLVAALTIDKKTTWVAALGDKLINCRFDISLIEPGGFSAGLKIQMRPGRRIAIPIDEFRTAIRGNL